MINKLLISIFLFTILKKIFVNSTESCQELARNPSNYCLACAESYYSFQESAFRLNPFPKEDCRPKSNATFEMEFYVSEKECLKTDLCDGSQESPFDNLVFALDLINNRTKMFSLNIIKIYLLGEEIFILQKDISASSKYFFRNSHIILTISTFPCSIKNISGCKEGNETIKINLKTNQILFFISVSINIKNIVFFGMDMPLEIEDTCIPIACFSEKITCCNDQDITIELLNKCIVDFNQSNVILNKDNLFGLFNLEISATSKNLTNNMLESIYPNLVIENCVFEKISTFFPSNIARFSSLVQIIGSFLSLTLKNLLFVECSLLDGILRQIDADETTDIVNYPQQTINISNVSIANIKAVNYDTRVSHSIIYIAQYLGGININGVSISQSDSILIFLDINNVKSKFIIHDVYLRENQDISFLRSKGCKFLKIEGLIYSKSMLRLMNENNFLIDLRDIGELYLGQSSVLESYFVQSAKTPYALVLYNINTNVELYNIHFERIVCFAISVRATILSWQQFVVIDLLSDFSLISSKGCSIIFKEILLSYAEIRFPFLVSMESGKTGLDFVLNVSQGHFSNIKFYKDVTDNGVFEWPVFTKKDAVLMRDISVYNCTHAIIRRYVNFFIAYSFAKVVFENADFSFYQSGRSSLLFLRDPTDVRFENISFRSNLRIDYYLIAIQCSDCPISFSNIKVLGAAFTHACFYFAGKSGTFENFTFLNISGILRQVISNGAYSYNYGLIVYESLEYCAIANWLFSSSEQYKFTPSRFFYFLNNDNINIQNVTFQVSEIMSMFSAPETHILAAIYNKNISIHGFRAKNFFCQTSNSGNTLYDSGIISFFNSQTFLKENNPFTIVHIVDLLIENCKFCKNGAIGLINIKDVCLNKTLILRTENIYGGATAIYFGSKILIENFYVQNTSALQNGGAVYLVGCLSLIVSNAFIFNTNAQLGGAVFLKGVYYLTFINLTCINNRAQTDGGVLYALDSNFSIEGGLALEYLALKEGGFAYIKRGNARLTGGFSALLGLAFNGAFVFAFDVVELYFNDLDVRNNSAIEKGITFFFEDCSKIYAENFTLTDIYSASGFGNIYLAIRSKSAVYEFKNVICLRVSMISCVLIYLEKELGFNKNFNITFTDILIAQGYGSIVYFKSSNLYKEHNFILQNITVSFFNREASYIDIPKQAFLFDSTFLMLRNLSYINSSFKYQCLSFFNSEIIIDTYYFQGIDFSLAELEIRFLFYLSNTMACLFKIIFPGDIISNNLALLSLEKSELYMQTGFLLKCHSYFTSCIDAYLSNMRISFYQFFENKGYLSGVMNIRNSTLILENSTFKANSEVYSERTKSPNILVNNIVLYGSENSKTSIIRNCQFLEFNPGISLVVNSSAINISHCDFSAKISGDLNIHLKAIWSISSDLGIDFTDFSDFTSKNGGTLRNENQNSKPQEVRFFTMQHSKISKSISDYGGAFSVFGLMKLFISENLFSYNSALKNTNFEYGNFGVGVFITNSMEITSFLLYNNTFLNNYAANGIATVFSNNKIMTSPLLSLSDPAVYFDTNKYENNTDGINFAGNLSFLPLKTKFFIRGSNINILNYESLKLTESYYLNNTVNQTYQNQSSAQESVQTVDAKNFSSLDINSSYLLGFKSGQSFDLDFLLTDDLDQIFELDQDSSSIIIDTYRGDLDFFQISNKYCLSYKGEFLYKNLIIKAELSKNFELQIEIKLNSNYLYYESKNFIKIETQRLKFLTKPCEIGDIIIEGDSSCLKCPFGKFSLTNPMKNFNISNFNLKCLNCPLNAVCPGGSAIVPKKGYWRYSNTTTLIVECLSKFSCLGFDDGKLKDEEKVHGKCLQNSNGPLCYTCESGFGRFSKKGLCKMCANEIESYIKLIIIILMFLGYSLIQINFTFQKSKTSTTGTLLKIVVTHFQQLRLISLVELGWTPEFDAFLSLQEVFTFLTEDLLPLECLLQTFGYNIYVQKVIATNIYPIVLSMILIIFWIAILLIFSKKISLIIDIIRVAFFIVIVLLFPEVISKCLSLLTCLTIDDLTSTKLLLYSPEVICWNDEHKLFLMYVAVPGLIGWGVIAPSLIAFFLLRNKSQIKAVIGEGNNNTYSKINFSLKTKTKFEKVENAIILKFLYKGYSGKYFYWELFMFLKKFLLISIGCISDLFPSNLRGVFLLVLITFLMLIQIRSEPFESPNLNRLEFFSLLATFLTANVGILMFSINSKAFAVTLLTFVIFIHTLFLIFWAYLLFKEIFASKSNIKFNIVLLRILRKSKVKILPSEVVSSKKILNFRSPLK